MVGFLTLDCKRIQVPMGYLSGMTSDSWLWCWDNTANEPQDFGVPRQSGESRMSKVRSSVA